jgi:hypothetical protein
MSDQEKGEYATMLLEIESNGKDLTEWEKEFLSSNVEKAHKYQEVRVSEKQQAIIRRIHEQRVGVSQG